MATDAAAPAAPGRTLPYLAEKHHDRVIGTMPELSRPLRKAPKALGGFDSGRIRGRDAAALRRLPSLSSLPARDSPSLLRATAASASLPTSTRATAHLCMRTASTRV